MVVKRVGSCQEHTWVIEQRVGSCAWLTLSLHATWLVLRAVFPWHRLLPFLSKSKFLGSMGPNKCWDAQQKCWYFSGQLPTSFYLPTSTPHSPPQYTGWIQPCWKVILRGCTNSQVWPSRKQFPYYQGTTCPCCSPLGYEYHRRLWSLAQRNYLI